MKVFRKFEEDNSSVLGGGPVQRVLFPSARGTRSRGLRSVQEEIPPSADPKENEGFLGGASDDDEEEIDHFAAIFESDNAPSTPIKKSKKITTIKKVEKKIEVHLKTVVEEKIIANKSDLDKEGSKFDEENAVEAVAEEEAEEAEEDEGAEEEKVEPEKAVIEEQPEKSTRAPSVAPSVSSVASSNILGFGRRPRITKSVSNLSNGEGKAPALRRSKRLASVEPEPIPEIGKATIKQKLASKRSRGEELALDDTQRWALGVQGGTRKKTKN